jgi:hypothetical protein
VVAAALLWEERYVRPCYRPYTPYSPRLGGVDQTQRAFCWRGCEQGQYVLASLGPSASAESKGAAGSTLPRRETPWRWGGALWNPNGREVGCPWGVGKCKPPFRLPFRTRDSAPARLLKRRAAIRSSGRFVAFTASSLQSEEFSRHPIALMLSSWVRRRLGGNWYRHIPVNFYQTARCYIAGDSAFRFIPEGKHPDHAPGIRAALCVIS